MTGKELIIYILQNNLEDEQIFKDGVFIGMISEKQAAVKFDVGLSTIRTWYVMRRLPGFCIGDSLYFLANVEDPRKELKNEDSNR